MKITVLNGSPRAGGNTAIMCEEFARGAADAGHSVEILNVGGKKVAGCLGCMYCFSHGGVCCQKDDMTEIIEKIDASDMIVFASPVYWFDIAAQLKAVIDRMFVKASVGFNFNKVAMLLNSGDDGVFEAAKTMLASTCAFCRWENLGVVCIPGMKNKGDMRNSDKLPEVYAFGRSLA